MLQQSSFLRRDGKLVFLEHRAQRHREFEKYFEGSESRMAAGQLGASALLF